MQEKGIGQYLQRELKNSRLCAYGIEYSIEAKELEHNREGLLTSEEHSKMSELDFSDHFSDIGTLKQWYFSYLNNVNKLEALSVVGEAIRGGHCKNIVSFGSGPSVLELYLKDMFQKKIKVVVTDYDKFIMSRVQTLMPEITALTFDFYTDDPAKIIEDSTADTVILFGSACSMDEETYIKFLGRIAETGVKNIFTFEAAIGSCLKYYLYPFCLVLKILFLYLFKRKKYEERKKRFENQSSFHAYKRTRNKLKRIYKLAGWDYEHVRCGTWDYGYRLFRV